MINHVNAGARATHAPRRTRTRMTSRERRSAAVGIGFMTPAMLMVLVFFVLPMALLLWMSVHNWPLLGTASPNGLDNYANAFTDETFGRALLFTLLFTALCMPAQVILGYLLAMVVRRQLAGVAALRTMYFVPVVVGTAAASYMFVAMLQPGSGLLDQAFQLLGLTDGVRPVLTDFNLALAVTVAFTTWKNAGTAMVLLMAGMQSVPEEVHEAATMDGAGWFRRETLITLPLIRQSMALVVILTVVSCFLSFDQFWILTNGGPQGTTITAVMWIYTVGFVRYRLGYGAALAVLLVIALVIVSILQLRVLREDSEVTA